MTRSFQGPGESIRRDPVAMTSLSRRRKRVPQLLHRWGWAYIMKPRAAGAMHHNVMEKLRDMIAIYACPLARGWDGNQSSRSESGSCMAVKSGTTEPAVIEMEVNWIAQAPVRKGLEATTRRVSSDGCRRCALISGLSIVPQDQTCHSWIKCRLWGGGKGS